MKRNIIEEIIVGIAAGGYAKDIMPAGLKQSDNCISCVYGGDNRTVNFCKRPKEQVCYRKD